MDAVSCPRCSTGYHVQQPTHMRPSRPFVELEPDSRLAPPPCRQVLEEVLQGAPGLPSRELRAELGVRGVDSSRCIERADLLELARFRSQCCGAAECLTSLNGSCLQLLPCGHHCCGRRGHGACMPCLVESCMDAEAPRVSPTAPPPWQGGRRTGCDDNGGSNGPRVCACQCLIVPTGEFRMVPCRFEARPAPPWWPQQHASWWLLHHSGSRNSLDATGCSSLCVAEHRGACRTSCKQPRAGACAHPFGLQQVEYASCFLPHPLNSAGPV
jgi:hypothetical protein